MTSLQLTGLHNIIRRWVITLMFMFSMRIEAHWLWLKWCSTGQEYCTICVFLEHKYFINGDISPCERLQLSSGWWWRMVDPVWWGWKADLVDSPGCLKYEMTLDVSRGIEFSSAIPIQRSEYWLRNPGFPGNKASSNIATSARVRSRFFSSSNSNHPYFTPVFSNGYMPVLLRGVQL